MLKSIPGLRCHPIYTIDAGTNVTTGPTGRTNWILPHSDQNQNQEVVPTIPTSATIPGCIDDSGVWERGGGVAWGVCTLIQYLQNELGHSRRWPLLRESLKPDMLQIYHCMIKK